MAEACAQPALDTQSVHTHMVLCKCGFCTHVLMLMESMRPALCLQTTSLGCGPLVTHQTAWPKSTGQADACTNQTGERKQELVTWAKRQKSAVCYDVPERHVNKNKLFILSCWHRGIELLARWPPWAGSLPSIVLGIQ